MQFVCWDPLYFSLRSFPPQHLTHSCLSMCLNCTPVCVVKNYMCDYGYMWKQAQLTKLQIRYINISVTSLCPLTCHVLHACMREYTCTTCMYERYTCTTCMYERYTCTTCMYEQIYMYYMHVWEIYMYYMHVWANIHVLHACMRDIHVLHACMRDIHVLHACMREYTCTTCMHERINIQVWLPLY